MKKKSKFILYILACLLLVLDEPLVNLVISLLIGSIQIGSMDYFIKISLISVGIIIYYLSYPGLCELPL